MQWRPYGEPLPTDLGGDVTAIAFNPDGSTLAVADSTYDVQLWNRETRQRAGGSAIAPTWPDDPPAGGGTAVQLWTTPGAR